MNVWMINRRLTTPSAGHAPVSNTERGRERKTLHSISSIIENVGRVSVSIDFKREMVVIFID